MPKKGVFVSLLLYSIKKERTFTTSKYLFLGSEKAINQLYAYCWYRKKEWQTSNRKYKTENPFNSAVDCIQNVRFQYNVIFFCENIFKYSVE